MLVATSSPQDIWIRNEGDSEWVFAGQTTPYRSRRKATRGWYGHKMPDYHHLLTGDTHTIRWGNESK